MMLHKLLHIFITSAIVAAFMACSSDDGQSAGVDMPNAANCYVDFAISVSNGQQSMTRANAPTGGENGDGREAGFEEENAVTGITVILYKDAAGINTSSDPTLDLVRYFPVILGHRDNQGTVYTTKTEEAWYHTGKQPLGKHRLDLTATYHAIVIANAPEVAASLTEGTSTLSNVRDLTMRTLYAGSPTRQAQYCMNFAMSSEQDNTINFSTVTVTNLDGTAYTPGNDMFYDLTTQAVTIERMAARIDFWAENSNGYKTSADNAAYTIPGYEYNVTGCSDKFVVTGIVPFNLTNGHATYGNEYLLKRLRTDITDASTTSYLEDETTTTWVMDPHTTAKLSATNPNLTNSLENVYTLIGDGSKLENTTDNPYYHSVETLHGSTRKSFINSKENVVLCYPMENTLLPESKLYYHATGIAIVGYYYVNGTGTGTRYVYLGYMRHQGEDETYEITPNTTPLGTEATMGTSTAMNFGVVRNNIYRISVNRVSPDAGKLELHIAVHDWRNVQHPEIYI